MLSPEWQLAIRGMRTADALNPGMAIHASRAELTDMLSVAWQRMSGHS